MLNINGITILLIFLCYQNGFVASDISPFLSYVGDYEINSTVLPNNSISVTVKEYYLSERIAEDYFGALLTCQSDGMELVNVESTKESQNLARIAVNRPHKFYEGIFMSSNSSSKSNEDECLSFSAPKTLKLPIKAVSCGVELNFMCEVIKVQTYDNTRNITSTDEVESAKVIDNIFTYLGETEIIKDEEDDNSETVKNKTMKYYLSKGLLTTPNEASMVCKSFNMNLASPKNQVEFDEFIAVLAYYCLRGSFSHSVEWRDATIAGYRSKENEAEWHVSGKLVEYRGTLKHFYNHFKHDCLGVGYNNNQNLASITLDCESVHPFICEAIDSENSTTDVKFITNKEGVLKPLTENENASNFAKSLYVSTVKRNWINAFSVCRVFGMDLFLPETVDEEKEMIELMELDNEHLSEVHIGATSINRLFWYSINDGKIINVDMEIRYQNAFEQNRCLSVDVKLENVYQESNCRGTRRTFICREVRNNQMHDEIKYQFNKKSNE
ncbi:CLUMA_CG003195, isoform A [Clunio marinus]|uniref:CLUMA_CG003195, isoform A n=1 Tax=Clunio marinus TaxID=568069 RepID=A0A1J1HPJ1_9DIPT|nr:CLUMA_CG003195, isoform A [Clunio marinus]